MLNALLKPQKITRFHGCHIEVNDKAVPAFYAFASQIDVDMNRNMAATATVKFDDMPELNGDRVVTDSEVFKVGDKIKITVDFGTYKEVLFVGFIVSTHTDFAENKSTGPFTIRCQDESFDMDQTHKRISWNSKTPKPDGQIVAEIASSYGLSLHRENAAGLTIANLVQTDSDICFIRQRAEKNGFDLLIFDGTLYFGPQRMTNQYENVIKINAGKLTSCRNFSVSNDTHRADLIAFDMAKEDGAGVDQHVVSPNLKLLGEKPAKSSRSKIGESKRWLTVSGTPSFEEVKAYAQGKVNEESLRVKATGTIDSHLYGHVLIPTMVVCVDGAGSLNSGNYYVHSVVHSLAPGSYTQKFELVRNGIGNDGAMPNQNSVLQFRADS